MATLRGQVEQNEDVYIAVRETLRDRRDLVRIEAVDILLRFDAAELFYVYAFVLNDENTEVGLRAIVY